MRSMKKKFVAFGALAIILAIIIFLLAGFLTDKKHDDTVKIGAITPLTGSASVYGSSTQKGLDLAVEEINEGGGIKGNNLTIIYEDSKCDPKTATSSFRRLDSLGMNIVVGTVCSSVTLSLGSEVDGEESFLISSGSSNPKISKYNDIFRTWPSDSIQGKFLGEFVESNLSMDKVGIIYIKNDYGEGLKEAFKDGFEGDVVVEESIPEGARDVRHQITKLKGQDLDGVFMATYSKEMGRILKQAHQLDLDVQFFGGEGTKDTSVIDVGGEGAEGVIGTVPHTKNTSKRKHFLSKFKEKYGIKPGITADSAYDIPFLLKNAWKKCKISDVSCVKDRLRNMGSYKGASGEIEFSSEGDLMGKKYKVVKVENGKFVPFKDS